MRTKELPKAALFIPILLCLMLIFDPYMIFGVMITDIIAIALCFWSFLKYRFAIERNLLILMVAYLFLMFISMIFTFSSDTNLILAIKVFIASMIYLVAFSNVWDWMSRDLFFKVVIVFGLVNAIFLILQYVVVSAGFLGFYTGRLPFLTGEYNTFASLIDPNTGHIRVHAFFEEPSYFAIFELPIFAYCIKNRKIAFAIIIGLSCVMSSSLLGVVGAVAILCYCLLCDSSIKSNQRMRSIVVLMIALVGVLALYIINDEFQTIIDRYILRIMSIQKDFDRADSSVSQRLMGNIKLFDEYNLFNKIFGVGFNQYHLYFGLEKNYSNDFVSILLDFGILGLSALLIVMFNYRQIIFKGERVYFWIWIMVLATDHIWFSNLFFYLFTWMAINRKENSSLTLVMRK